MVLGFFFFIYNNSYLNFDLIQSWYRSKSASIGRYQIELTDINLNLLVSAGRYDPIRPKSGQISANQPKSMRINTKSRNEKKSTDTQAVVSPTAPRVGPHRMPMWHSCSCVGAFLPVHHSKCLL